MNPDQSDRPASTIWDAVTAATARLSAAGFSTPRLDAEVLMRHITGLDRTAYFLRRSEPLSNTEKSAFNGLIERRMRREPIAYLVEAREFMGFRFNVGPGVLVPRPETEILVEWALEWLTARAKPAHLLEIGTGTGAIPLSIASLASPDRLRSVVGCDISGDALRYAVANRDRIGLSRAVGLVRGDLATWHEGRVDLLLANLPYLRPEQVVENPDLAPEPTLALDGGSDGLDLIRRLLADAPRLLSTGGAIGLEIDPSQAERVMALGRENRPDLLWSVLSDLAGWPRHVVGVTPQRFIATRTSSAIS